MALYIKSISHYVPPGRLTNEDLSQMVDTNHEWIVTRTGICERAIAEPGVATSDLAYHASVDALAKAGLKADQLEAIICSTCTPDMSMPGSSSFLQSKLKAPEMMTLDVNAACSGFVYGLEVVEGLLATGKYENILFSCSEKFSSTINYKDRSTCILFGDGAGSLIVSSKPGGAKLVATYISGNGNLAHLLHRPGGGSLAPVHEVENNDDLFVQMEGKEVFKHAVRGMGLAAEKTLERAGWKDEDIDWLVPHQANMRLIKSAAERLSIPLEKVLVNIEKYGNMSAASIPVVLSEFQDRFQPGNKILCLAFGAGFTWGGVALEWES